jgi:serine protease inhibitor ecotin
MRKLAFALAIGLLASAGGLGTAVQRVNAAASQAKVVIVVGAVEGMTSSYRTDGDSAAASFSKYTSNIVKVYSPNATWANVQAAAQGASILVYLGHGSGYPNPYNKNPVAGDSGMGLNATAANTDYNRQYYGAGYMAQLNLAPNAVVFLNHLCYASGDSEPGNGNPTPSVAQTRVDGYASGFLKGNARTVIAEGMGSLSSYIDALFSTHQTIDQLWKTYPGFHNHVTSWASTHNAGYTSQIDPNLDHPQSDGDVYYRSMVSLPGLTTDNVGQGPTTTYTPATYHPLSPTRILDTRNGIGLSGAFSSHVARTFGVAGQGGVPINATAVTGNLTVTQQTSLGYLYIGPNAMNNPTSSTLNFPLGDDRADGVTVALGDEGTLSVTYVAPTSGSTTHVVFDVTGYFAPELTGAKYVPLAPARILDSRDGTGGLSGPFSSHVARTFGITGHGGVPAGATAVTGNLTVTGQSSLGYLYMGPNAMNNPTSSTLNFPLNDDRANAVTVALDGSGQLSITYVAAPGASAQVIFDVTGYFTPDSTGATYVALTPARVLDSRDGYWIGLSGASGSHVARTFTVSGHGGVPSNAIAVTGNLTVTGQTALGYLYVGPNAMDDPTSSTLNFPLGDDRANAVTVALGAGGTLSVTYVAVPGATAQVIFDVTGYFTP